MSDITFRFSGSPNDAHEFKWQPVTSHQFVTDIMKQHTRNNPVFNDLDFYMMRKNQKTNVSVDLTAVRCRHSGYFFGLQAKYKIISLDGSKREEWAPEHFFEWGYYSYAGGEKHDRTFLLQDGEFITGIDIQQGEIVDGVTFVTNKRTAHFGGHRGSFSKMSPPKPTQRVFAFAGVEGGVLQKIGYFAEKISWEILGPLIMLHWLVGKNRATCKTPDAACTQAQLAVRNLLGLEGHDDIFYHVLYFLKP